MIKKKTILVFPQGSKEEQMGGMPLSLGDKIRMTEDGSEHELSVKDKRTEAYKRGTDWHVTTTYFLEK